MAADVRFALSVNRLGSKYQQRTVKLTHHQTSKSFRTIPTGRKSFAGWFVALGGGIGRSNRQNGSMGKKRMAMFWMIIAAHVRSATGPAFSEPRPYGHQHRLNAIIVDADGSERRCTSARDSALRLGNAAVHIAPSQTFGKAFRCPPANMAEKCYAPFKPELASLTINKPARFVVLMVFIYSGPRGTADNNNKESMRRHGRSRFHSKRTLFHSKSFFCISALNRHGR